MTDLSTFNPTSIDDLLGRILSDGQQAIGRPIENVQSLRGHLRQLASDSLDTAKALAEGRIDAQTAREAFEGRKEVLVQMAEFVQLMGLQAAQRATDAIFRVIGWAIFNRTGINVAPGLVNPG